MMRVPCAAASFKIHYVGWHARHDDWVPRSRIRPLDFDFAETLDVVAPVTGGGKRARHQRDVGDQCLAPSASLAPTCTPTATAVAATSSGEPIARKRPVAAAARSTSQLAQDVMRRDIVNDTVEQRVRLPSLPRELIDVLAADWIQVTRAPRLWIPLPRSPSCADILATFATTKSGSPGAAAWADLAAGLRVYFDVALPKLLLYRQEREQYDRFARGGSLCLICVAPKKERPRTVRLGVRLYSSPHRPRRAISYLWR